MKCLLLNFILILLDQSFFRNIFNEYLEKYQFDTYDYVKTMEFIIDIKTKNMIIKGLKDAGKYLIYDKEKFTDFDQIENELLEQ